MIGSPVQPREFIDYVTSRGYKALPLTNSQAVAEGAELKIMAYELVGPRHNRTIVMKNADGLLPLDDAALWCDGVDYATKKVASKRRV